MVFEYRRKIYGFDCDIYGHLNNANYLRIYEEARSEALDKMGLSLSVLSEERIEIYLKRAELDYQLGVPFSKEISVLSRVKDLTRVKSVWLQEMFDPESEILYNRAVIIGVFIRNKKPFRLPDNIFDIFYRYL